MVHSRLALALALWTTTGCEAPVVNFDVELASETVVEGSGVLGQVLDQFPAFDQFTAFDVSAEDEFENNNAQKDLVEEARVTRFSLVVTDPAGADLDFLDAITFYVEAPDLDRTRIAQKEIDDGQSSVDLDLDEVDLAPYVRADTMTFSTDITGRQPADDTTVRAEVILNITAGLAP